MNHLKTVSDEAMSLLRSIIKLNVGDVRKILYYLEKRERGNGGNVKTAIILVEYTNYKHRSTSALYIIPIRFSSNVFFIKSSYTCI